MTILKKFLNKTALISGLIAMSLITIPYVDAAPKRNNKARIAKSTSKATVSSNRGNRAVRSNSTRSVAARPSRTRNVAVSPNRTQSVATSPNTLRATQVNRANRPAAIKNTRENRITTVNRNHDGGRNRISRNTQPSNTVYNNNSYYNNSNNNNSSNVTYNSRPNHRISNRKYRRGYGRSGSFYTGLVGGALLYSALNHNSYYNSYYGINYSYGYPYNYGYDYSSYGYNYPYYGSGYNYYSPSYRYTPSTQVVYVDRPVEVPVYQDQPIDPAYLPEEDPNCLQVREYTTTIEIGGEGVPAYGQACLQPDGSWKFGGPIAVPSF